MTSDILLAPGQNPEIKVSVKVSLAHNSGSITGGNDPIGQRFTEVQIAFASIARRCKCGQCMAATLHFDTPTSGDLQPTRIARDTLEDISKSLAIPADGAGISALLPALGAAKSIADNHRDHRTILIALTDFQLFDNYLPTFLDFPGDLHAVSLFAAPPRELIDAPDVAVTHITHDSPPGTLARATFSGMCSHRTGSAPLPAIPGT